MEIGVNTGDGRLRVVAVDGPSAAGKTTASTAIAQELGLAYLESGTSYRLLAYRALADHVSAADTGRIVDLADEIFSDTTILTSAHIDPKYLRAPEVSRFVASVAKVPDVREKLTSMMRIWASTSGRCIIEGRDIGTAVFPAAEVKFYLDASPEVRAKRRQIDEGRSYEVVLQDVVRRDHEDSSREHSPLRPAMDATIIDTSELSIHQVQARMLPECVQLMERRA